MPKPDTYERRMIDVLTPKMKKLLKDYYTMQVFKLCGCTRADGFEKLGLVPQAPMERISVFRASKEKGTYNHHSCLAKWKGKYWFAWSNCLVNEEDPGQKTLIAVSEDARRWSEPHIVADGDASRGMLRNISGLYATEQKLYAFIQEKWNTVLATDPGMSVYENAKVSYRNDLWETEDGINWKLSRKKHLDIMWTFAPPRLTKKGRLMGPATTHALKPAVVLWPGDDPEEKPEIIEIPYKANTDDYYAGHDEGLFHYGEASWYQDDDSRIWLWHRDESGSCRLGVALSEDGGRTWTEVIRSNFPDSMSRVSAGRLNDGRFFIIGNSTYQFMDRNFFAILMSNDGAKFDQIYQLIGERTTQRFPGHLKTHGYQYPCALIDGDRLLIGYSVNKEDIECGIVGTSRL